MLRRILSAGAVVLSGLALVLPVRAAQVETAQETLNTISGLLNTVPAMIEGDDIARAGEALTQARNQTTEFVRAMTAIQSSAKNMSQPLGEAWGDPVETAQGLDTIVATALSNPATADMDEVLQSVDGARNALTTAVSFSQNFGRQLAAFNEQQVGSMNTSYKGDLTRLQGYLVTALTSRPRDFPGANAAMVSLLGLLDPMMRNTGNYTTLAAGFGREVGDHWAPVPPAITALQSALQDLQEVAGVSGFDNEFSTEKKAFETLGTTLSDAMNSIASSQGAFILICDSACR